ncbi:hypothetical protein [Shewanella aestuarii]|uniref:Uncharacterized protein n=1 Tax=Shewanella aestuarii TaxID=1028752 RepID=A0A6G9QPZ1_9GAMM|nr:hypothetical protein [Shewanella aestuarii]QIR16488.1 hypothetical protein HBH39_18605 [Shewanella aestuarii]
MEDQNRDMLIFLEFFGIISESVCAGHDTVEIDTSLIKSDCSCQISQLKETCAELGVNLVVL